MGANIKRKAQRIRRKRWKGKERKAERVNCGRDQRGGRERRKGERWDVRENDTKEMRGKQGG